MRIVGYAQMRNGCRDGYLEHFLKNMVAIVGADNFVLFDNASEDDSVDFASKYTSHIIRSSTNEFTNELFTKQRLLSYCRDVLKGDWIYWNDIDTLASRTMTDENGVNEIIQWAEKNGIDGVGIWWKNLYLSDRYERIDSQFNCYGQANIYKIKKDTQFKPRYGLHMCQTPPFSNHLDVPPQFNACILHFGFSSLDRIISKYRQYAALGQAGEALERIINMDWMELLPVREDEFPSHYHVEGNSAPQKVDLEWLRREVLGLDET